MPEYQIINSDCIEAMRGMPDASVDAIVTDPPYELGFMGKSWDASGIAYRVDMWREALRVLKPGGHLLAFSGSRTYHRMVVAIEDAGFEIRDQIMWVYGSGFPKSLDVSKAIDKISPRLALLGKRYELADHIRACRNAAGKTAAEVNSWFGYASGVQHWESKNESGHRFPSVTDWAMLRDRIGVSDDWLPLIERVEAEREVIGQRTTGIGTGGGSTPIMGDGNRDITAPSTDDARRWEGWGTALKPAHEPICVARKPLVGTVAANVLAFGTGAINIDGCRVGSSKDVPASNSNAANNVYGAASVRDENRSGMNPGIGRWPANIIHDGSDEVVALFPSQAGASAPVRGTEASAASVGRVTGERDRVPGAFHADAGSAARFFYCAKASRKDRNAGCEGMPQQMPSNAIDRAAQREGQEGAAGRGSKSGPRENHHPTVKPTDLMAYLVRLVTPPGGLVLDPFMGSGSTGKACMREGFQFIGCELSAEYVAIAEARIQHELYGDIL